MSSVQDRITATINRADDLLRERLRREKTSLERQDAERADAAREQARADLALPRDRRAVRQLVPFVRRLDAEPVDGDGQIPPPPVR